MRARPFHDPVQSGPPAPYPRRSKRILSGTYEERLKTCTRASHRATTTLCQRYRSEYREVYSRERDAGRSTVQAQTTARKAVIKAHWDEYRRLYEKLRDSPEQDS